MLFYSLQHIKSKYFGMKNGPAGSGAIKETTSFGNVNTITDLLGKRVVIH